MLLRITWTLTLILSALGLGLGWAHVLEMPAKLAFDAALYVEVNRTLYRLFGLVGGPVQVLALVSAIGLCVVVRRHRQRRAFGYVLAGTIALAISLTLWATLVQPVNAAWADVLAHDPSRAPERYIELRTRWEYGHAAAFVAWLSGFVGLVIGIVREGCRRRM